MQSPMSAHRVCSTIAILAKGAVKGVTREGDVREVNPRRRKMARNEYRQAFFIGVVGHEARTGDVKNP